MRNAKLPIASTIAAISFAALAVSACHKKQQDQNISIDEGIPENQFAGNADVETLPPDESSTTPLNQLQNGSDNPDVNDIGNSNSG